MTKETQEYLDKSHKIYEEYLRDETQFIMTDDERKYIQRLNEAYKEFLKYENEVEKLVLYTSDPEKIDDIFKDSITEKLKCLKIKRYKLTFSDILFENNNEKMISSKDAKNIFLFFETEDLLKDRRIHRYLNMINILFYYYFSTT